MSYKRMKLDELLALCASRGIEPFDGCKKADLVAMLEANDAGEAPAPEVEVVEDGEEVSLTTSISAGTAWANFEALDKRADEILAQYEGWEPSPDNPGDVEQCARERKYLNGLAKQVDEARKSAKAQYMRPIEAFEAQANTIRDKLKAGAKRMQQVEATAEEWRRAGVKAELCEYYDDMAGELAGVLPYDRIHDERWTNKTFGAQKAKMEIEKRLTEVSKALQSIRALGLEYGDEAEARYLECLDIGEAVNFAREQAERKAALEAMRNPVPPAPAPEPAPAAYPAPQAVENVPAAPVPMAAPAPMAAPMPAPALMAAPMPAPVFEEVEPAQPAPGEFEELVARLRAVATDEDVMAELAAMVPIAPVNGEDEPKPRVMCVESATVAQCRRAGRLLGAIGITGTFKTGTLDQAYQHWVYEQKQAAMAQMGGYRG